MRKTFLRLGSLFALLAVILGAFGSHTLREVLTPKDLAIFETGVRYQFYHAFALIAAGILLYLRKTSFLPIAGWLFTAGILLFSGSLYFLAIDEAMGLSFSWMGPITPIGGTLFILGWAAFLGSTFQVNQRRYHKEE